MLVSHRGGFGEEHPWQIEGGGVTEHVLDALRIQYVTLDKPGHVAHRVRQAVALTEASLWAGGPAALRRPDVGRLRGETDAQCQRPARHLSRAVAVHRGHQHGSYPWSYLAPLLVVRLAVHIPHARRHRP